VLPWVITTLPVIGMRVNLSSEPFSYVYAGVDLGTKESGVAVITDWNIELYTIRNEDLVDFLQKNAKIVSIDAPLTRGDAWRDCDRAIAWAKPLPLNLPSMKKLMEEGIKLREELENSMEVIESFTTGIKKILGIKLHELGYRINKKPNYHEIDAGFLAYNSFLHRYGATEAYGKECKIYLPMKRVGEVLREQIRLKDKVRVENPGEIDSVAGVDVHYKNSTAYAAAVVLENYVVVEKRKVKVRVDFP